MTRTITQRELRNGSAEIMDSVVAGEALVVTRNGVPVAELRPIGRRRFVPRAEALAAFRHQPGLSLEELRADLDAALGDDRLDE